MQSNICTESILSYSSSGESGEPSPAKSPETESDEVTAAAYTLLDLSSETPGNRAEQGEVKDPEPGGRARPVRRRRNADPISTDPEIQTARKYYLRYRGNNSKKWDGKGIVVDGDTLESLYALEELQSLAKRSLFLGPRKEVEGSTCGLKADIPGASI